MYNKSKLTYEDIEIRQRINWFIDGYFIHCIPIELFKNLSTERICELYNVNLKYFGR